MTRNESAAIAVLKKGGRRFSVSLEENSLDLASKLPEERKRKVDVRAETLLNGNWQLRRIVLTRDVLYFAMVDEEEVRDSIPLHEISIIEIMIDPHQLEGLMNLSQGPGTTQATSTKPRRGSVVAAFMPKEVEQDRPRKSLTLIHAFQIRTIPDGFNSGRVYYIQTQDAQSCSNFVTELKSLTDEAVKRAENATRFRRSQKFVASIYYSNIFQALSAFMIVANFATCIATAQLSNGRTGEHENFLNLLDKLDVAFVFIFTFELLVNAYANWFTAFVENPWSLFDIIIVSFSIVGLAPYGIPLGLLLLLRSCRVLRIFGKFKSVSQIFAALAWSIVPMANVFFIIFVFASIYAIIAVTFFSEEAPEELSTFSRAFMSMFRITIGSVEWWFDAFPTVKPDFTLNWWPSFFLVTYVIIVTWVFFQVSIAVLLDNFLSASAAIKLEESIRAIRQKQVSKQFKNPLDPLLLRLSKDYINEADLTLRVQELFKVLDSDGSGDLSSIEFQEAMKKLDFSPRIFVSDSDFIAITKNRSLCNAQGNLGPREFETVMREQLRLYSQARLSTTSEYWATSDQDFTQLGSLKQILVEQLRLKEEQDTMKAQLLSVVTETKEEVRQMMAMMRGEGGVSTYAAAMAAKTRGRGIGAPRIRSPPPSAAVSDPPPTMKLEMSPGPPTGGSRGSENGGGGDADDARRRQSAPTAGDEAAAKRPGEGRKQTCVLSDSAFVSFHGELCLVDSVERQAADADPRPKEPSYGEDRGDRPPRKPPARTLTNLSDDGYARSPTVNGRNPERAPQQQDSVVISSQQEIAASNLPGALQASPRRTYPGTRQMKSRPSPRQSARARNYFHVEILDEGRNSSGSPTPRPLHISLPASQAGGAARDNPITPPAIERSASASSSTSRFRSSPVMANGASPGVSVSPSRGFELTRATSADAALLMNATPPTSALLEANGIATWHGPQGDLALQSPPEWKAVRRRGGSSRSERDSTSSVGNVLLC